MQSHEMSRLLTSLCQVFCTSLFMHAHARALLAASQFRGTLIEMPLPTDAGDTNSQSRHPLCAPDEGDLMTHMRLKRLLEGSGNAQCVGSGAFVTSSAVITARHCVIDGDGKFLDIYMDDIPLKFLAASPYDEHLLESVAAVANLSASSFP